MLWVNLQATAAANSTENPATALIQLHIAIQ